MSDAPPTNGGFIDALQRTLSRLIAKPSPTFTPMRVALMMAVWLVVIAVPFLIWLKVR